MWRPLEFILNVLPNGSRECCRLSELLDWIAYCRDNLYFSVKDLKGCRVGGRIGRKDAATCCFFFAMKRLFPRVRSVVIRVNALIRHGSLKATRKVPNLSNFACLQESWHTTRTRCLRKVEARFADALRVRNNGGESGRD